MTTRRGFLRTLLAASALPGLSWADAGSPAYLAAAQEADGGFAMFGLDAGGRDLFRIKLPARGHAGTAHPDRPEAVVFARRPGTFGLVIDCVTGAVLATLEAPAGRHFYGHGVFLPGGDVLVTPENDIATGEGRLGFWSRRDGWRRMGEAPSHGIGPHDIRLLPGSGMLVVANGGIRTDPARPKDKLNLDTMRPNLTYVDAEGTLLEKVELAPELSRNSIRHLAVGQDGLVAFAMQWEGDAFDAPPLLGLHRQGGGAPVLAETPLDEALAMDGYAGSVAFSGDGASVGITSPRGGRVHVFDRAGAFLASLRRADVCGLAAAPDGGFLASDGLGGVLSLKDGAARPLAKAGRAWDNHIVELRGARV